MLVRDRWEFHTEGTAGAKAQGREHALCLYEGEYLRVAERKKYREAKGEPVKLDWEETVNALHSPLRSGPWPITRWVPGKVSEHVGL